VREVKEAMFGRQFFQKRFAAHPDSSLLPTVEFDCSEWRLDGKRIADPSETQSARTDLDLGSSRLEEDLVPDWL
jgi:hypothetical protein